MEKEYVMSDKQKIELTDENEMSFCKKWIDSSKHVTEETLIEFINDIMYNYVHTYNSYVYACTACAIAVVHVYGAGLTGFQASVVAMMFPLYFWYGDNICGIRLYNYDEMLYPQYEYKFEKTITSDTWDALQAEAKTLIESSREDGSYVNQRVVNHWQSIVDGIVPFGYSVEN